MKSKENEWRITHTPLIIYIRNVFPSRQSWCLHISAFTSMCNYKAVDNRLKMMPLTTCELVSSGKRDVSVMSFSHLFKRLEIFPCKKLVR